MSAFKSFQCIFLLLSGPERRLYNKEIEEVNRALTDEQHLRAALRVLVDRCDGAEGVQPDGSNMDTRNAHFVLGDFDEEKEE